MKPNTQRRAALVVLGIAGLALGFDKVLLSGEISGPRQASASVQTVDAGPKSASTVRANDPSVMIALRLASHAPARTAPPTDAYALPLTWQPAINSDAKDERPSSSRVAAHEAAPELPIRSVRVASLVGREMVSIEFEAMLTSENGLRSIQRRSQSLQVGRPVRIEEGLILHLIRLGEADLELTVNGVSLPLEIPVSISKQVRTPKTP